MLDRPSNRQHLTKTRQVTYRNPIRPTAPGEYAGQHEAESEDGVEVNGELGRRQITFPYLGRSVRRTRE